MDINLFNVFCVLNNISGSYQWYPFDSYITQPKRQSYRKNLPILTIKQWSTNLIDRSSDDHLKSYEFRGVVRGWTMCQNSARTDVWRQLRAGLCCDISMLCMLCACLMLDIKSSVLSERTERKRNRAPQIHKLETLL